MSGLAQYLGVGMVNSGLADSLTPPKSPLLQLGARFPGLLAPGNLDLNARKVFNGPDGDYRTENSISIGTDQGEILIPTVVNGQQLSEEDAIKHFEQTGENLGVFADPSAAEKYAEMLHNRQANYYKANRKK